VIHSKIREVQQALERKKAKTAADTKEQPVPSSTEVADDKPDIEALEKQLTQAEAKLNTMQGMLDEARSQQADNVEKLERAVAKNHDRVQRAQQALDQARKQVAEEPASSQ